MHFCIMNLVLATVHSSAWYIHCATSVRAWFQHPVIISAQFCIKIFEHSHVEMLNLDTNNRLDINWHRWANRINVFGFIFFFKEYKFGSNTQGFWCSFITQSHCCHCGDTLKQCHWFCADVWCMNWKRTDANGKVRRITFTSGHPN